MNVHFVVHGEMFHSYFVQCFMNTLAQWGEETGSNVSYSFHKPLNFYNLLDELETIDLAERKDVEAVVFLDGKRIFGLEDILTYVTEENNHWNEHPLSAGVYDREFILTAFKDYYDQVGPYFTGVEEVEFDATWIMPLL